MSREKRRLQDFHGKKERGAEVIQLIKVEEAWVHSKEKNVNELKKKSWKLESL